MSQSPGRGIPLQYQRRMPGPDVQEVASYTRKVIMIFLAAVVIGCAGGGLVGALQVSAGTPANAAPPPQVLIIGLAVRLVSLALSILLIVNCWKLNKWVGWSGPLALLLLIPLGGLIYLVM